MEIGCMSKLIIVDTVTILTLCYELVTLVILYYFVTSDIKILKNVKSVDQLDKWALRYAKKRNFNKGIILRDLMKKIESIKKMNKIAKWCLLLQMIFVGIYFMPYQDVMRLGEKIIFAQESKKMLDDIMILCGISTFWAIYFVKLIHQRNIVAHEQFSRLL
jgi:hypothetical protein